MEQKRSNLRLTLWIVIILGLTPLLWFWRKQGLLIDGVDTNFPLNPLVWFIRRFFVWNGVVNGGLDFSSSVAGIFFHAVQLAPFLLGLNLQLVEIFSLVFWFLAISLSAYVFAKDIFKERAIPILIFVVFYAFNIYLFNSWENVKVANLSLMAGIPLGLSILYKLNTSEKNLSDLSLQICFLGLLIAGTGINPSYFISFFMTILVFQLVMMFVDRKLYLKNILSFSLVLFLINLFWIIPTGYFVFSNISATGSIYDLGYTNWLSSLSKDTSILNVMRMQGAWDWYAFDEVTGLPLYIPYALNFFKNFPFIVFSFLIPFLALFSLIVKKIENAHSKILYTAFALMVVLGIFLGAGSHPPTGYLFSFLSDHVPFFTLFRSPWYIFTPLLIVGYAGLIGLLFERLLKMELVLVKWIVYVFAGVLVIGNFLYSYPLISGKIFRPGRNDGFYVSFPDYVFTAAKWAQTINGRVISYPNDEIENFSWGYRGIESILLLASNTEVLFPSLNLTNEPIAQVSKEFYDNLIKGNLVAAERIAAKLNVSYIFYKDDQNSLAMPLAKEVIEASDKQFEKWHFYKFPEESLPKIISANNLFFAYPYFESEKILGFLEKDEMIVNPDDTVINTIANANEMFGKIIVSKNSQQEDFLDFVKSGKLADKLKSRDLSEVKYSFNIPADGEYNPVLERYRLEDFGFRENVNNYEVQIDDQKKVWIVEKENDDYLIFEKQFFKSGIHEVTMKLNNRNLVKGGNFDNGIEFEKGGYGEGEANYNIITSENSGNYLSILNIGKADASADFIVPEFDPLIPYFVQVNYQQIYGNKAVVMAGQDTKSALVKTTIEKLPNYPDWGVFSFYYDPVKTNSRLKVILSSPFTVDPLGTKIFYDELSVWKVFTNKLVLIGKGDNALKSPVVTYKKVSPVKYAVEVKDTKGPHAIAFLENFSNNWQAKIKGQNSKVIKLKEKHFSLNLYANGWYVEGAPQSYQMEIYYKPQNLYILGGTISFMSLMVGVGIFLFKKFRR